MMSRLISGLVLVMGLALSGCSTSTEVAQAPRRQPNVIVILADDLGYGDLSTYGGWIPTPNITALAASGVKFTDGYVTAAVCAPSRSALLSGRSQTRFGFEFNPVGRDANGGLPTTETVIPQVMKSAGYATGMVGKWHIGQAPGFHPLDRGFDSFYGVLGGATDFILKPEPGDLIAPIAGDHLTTRARFPVSRGHEDVVEPRYLTEAFTEEAIGFVRRNRDKPFFLYLAYNAPHTPLQATRKYADRFPQIQDPHRRAYAAMVSALDDGVGQLMAELKAQGLEKDTIVVFLSDNGCAGYVRGACSNAPLSGFKGMPWQGGVKVPYILSAPGRVKAGQQIGATVSSLDLMVTAAKAAGVAAPPTAEGADLLAMMDRREAPERGLFWRTGPNYAVREGRWKLLVVNKSDIVDDPNDVYGSPTPDGVGATISPLGQWVLLYDVRADPGEKVDLADRHPDVVQRLMAGYRAWDRQNGQPMWTSRRQFRTEVNGHKVQLYN